MALLGPDLCPARERPVSVPDPLVAAHARSRTIQGHDGQDVAIVWPPSVVSADEVPPFPFQVYVLDSAAQTASDPSFPAAFALWMDTVGRIGDGECRYRFEVHSDAGRFHNVLSCVEHQRREVQWRHRNGVWPRMVEKWVSGTEDGYVGFIVVVDADDWATTGELVFVKFDPAQYQRPGTYRSWNKAGEGDSDYVHASRRLDVKVLAPALFGWWMEAGHRWAQADLERRNDGGYSPALYPAVDPASHEDAGFHDGDDLLEAARPGPSEDERTQHGPRIRDTFRPDELWVVPSKSSSGIRTETYSDSQGRRTVSVWDGRKSVLRPDFSYTLYCSPNAVYAAEAFFSCLNKHLIADESWTLDVKYGFDTLDAAYRHHGRERARRTTRRVEVQKDCIQTLLRKIAGHRLPAELLIYIKDVLVLPRVPDYSGLPNRPFQNFFMYFDPSHQRAIADGPLLVYSHPSPMVESDRRDWEEDVLRVKCLRFWHRVADELHIIWSLSSPRSFVLPPESLPTVRLHVKGLQDPIVPQADLRPSSGVWPCSVGCSLEGSSQPIVAHMSQILAGRLWCDVLEMVDVATGQVCEPPFSPFRDTLLHWDSWCVADELGFKRQSAQEVAKGKHGMLQELRPDDRDVRELLWSFHGPGAPFSSGTLQEGREYAVRLKAGFEIQRWTYGTIGALKGPFNLPPLPVVMDEVRLRFTDLR